MASAFATKVRRIQARTGLLGADLAELLDTSPQTVSRWSNAKAVPQREYLQRVLDLGWIADRLSRVYEPDETKLWLYSRHPLLGGARPVDRIQQGHIDEVIALVDQLNSGAFV